MRTLIGHDVPFDLILVRPTGELERVQCKYTESDGGVVTVKCNSSSEWVRYNYTAALVDWMAVYGATTDCGFYLHSSEWDGHMELSLRLVSPANSQRLKIRWAVDHLSSGPPGNPGVESDQNWPPATIPRSAGVAQG